MTRLASVALALALAGCAATAPVADDAPLDDAEAVHAYLTDRGLDVRWSVTAGGDVARRLPGVSSTAFTVATVTPAPFADNASFTYAARSVTTRGSVATIEVFRPADVTEAQRIVLAARAQPRGARLFARGPLVVVAPVGLPVDVTRALVRAFGTERRI